MKTKQQESDSATSSKARYKLATVAETGDKSATTCIRQLVAVDTVANSVYFVADGRLCRPNVEHPFDFVASVYRTERRVVAV